MKIQAINDFVVVRAERNTDASKIFRIKTEQYNEKTDWLNEPWIVVSVGEKCTKVKVGDRVTFARTTDILRHTYLCKLMDEKTPENVEYFVGKEENIAAILN